MGESTARLCKFCTRPIGSMRGPVAIFCSRQCSQHAIKEKRKKVRDASDHIVHTCISSEFDNFNEAKCNCRLRLSDSKIERLFQENGARNLNPDHRQSMAWDRSDVFITGKLVHTPRVPTIERSHIFRGIQCPPQKPAKAKERGKTQTPEEAKSEYEDLQRRIKQDELERSEEARLRWETWAELQAEWLKSITIEIPETEWVASEKASRGDLACRTLLHVEERSSAGTDYHRFPSLESIEDQDDETTATTNTEIAENLQSLTFDGDSTTEIEINYRSLEDLSEDMAEAA